MKRLLTCLVLALISLPAVAGSHDTVETEVRAAVSAFNSTYANNDLDTYFSFYADDATLYFSGARQDVSAYHKSWAELIAAGGGVEKNTLSDLQVRVMPSGDVAVATYFIHYRMRMPNGDVSEARAFETDVWQKRNGEWKAVSLHYSEIPNEE